MEDRRPVQPSDVFRLNVLQEARLSPDGTAVLYGVSTVDPSTERDSGELWILSLATGATRRLISGPGRQFNAAWSPDGRQIAFLRECDGVPQVHCMPAEGGAARAVTAIRQGVTGRPAWSPDGRTLAFAGGLDEDVPDPVRPYRITRALYRVDGVGYLHRQAQNIYRVRPDGRDLVALTRGINLYGAPLWSPDGEDILFPVRCEPDHGSFYTSLKIVGRDGRVRTVVSDIGLGQNGSWTPDGRIVFTGTPGGRPYGYKYDLWVVGRDGRNPECRTAGLEVGVNGMMIGDLPVGWFQEYRPPLVTRDSRWACVPVQASGQVGIYRVALEGPEDWAPIVSGDRFCAPMDSDGERLLFLQSTLQDPANLRVCGLDGRAERPLTDLNRALLDRRRLPSAERLLFPSVDGREVEGWLLTPPSGKPPYPTILYIHGGPFAAVGHIYFFDYQMLAGAGYAVLFINQRGSSGYGDGFSTKILGAWGTLDYQDLMAGVDAAVARGLADPERLGVCGLSGGGNLSCWIVGHTDRFKAAVPENPVTNWVSMAGVSDIGVRFAAFANGGLLHETPETYARCSPITCAHRCRTPTLLVQAEQDYRCPAEQSEQFYSVLKTAGCPVEMVRLPNHFHCGSVIGTPLVRRIQNEVLLDWMNRYVLGLPDGGRVASL